MPHALLYLLLPIHTYLFIRVKFLVVKVIPVHYILEDRFYCYFFILVLLNWIVQVEILGIDDEVFGVWGGWDSLPIDFCGS